MFPLILSSPSGDLVSKGQHIANIGPKNVYGIPNNPYKDKDGNPTNGATTGCHLHLGIRLNNQYINPLSLFPYYQKQN